MTIIADLKVGEKGVPLSISGDGKVSVPVRILGGIPTHDGVILYVWLESTDDKSIPDISGEPVVEQISSVDSGSNYGVVAVTISNSATGFLAELDTPEIILLQGVDTDSGWFFRLQFDGQESLNALVRRCTTRDIPISVVQRYRSVDQQERSQYGLTPTQRETLRVAKQVGYFEVPRETSLTELGERLGVSDTAVSQRLRRGLATLLAATLTPDQTTNQ